VRALVCVGAGALVEFRHVPEPDPGADEALVRVAAVSVNRGELHRLVDPAMVGWRPGWDLAGEVLRAPPGRPDLAPGRRVLGFAPGGSWAERVRVPARQLAVLPEELPWTEAAALPAAGLTALRTLRALPRIAGCSVLVTGARSAVGRYAAQLGRRAGARVTGVVRQAAQVRQVRRCGADPVVVGTSGLPGGFDLVLESLGGPMLREAVRLVAPGGHVVCYGNSSRAETTFSISELYPKEATIRGFYLPTDVLRTPPDRDLHTLAELSAAGRLDPGVEVVADWTEAPSVLSRVAAGGIQGKAVLTTDSGRA
jgi:NADPH:quinone reductase-like Zn-dependent oxidoreductase